MTLPERLACPAGIDTPLRQAHFMAQIAHESDGFSRRVENLNYSAKRIRQIGNASKPGTRWRSLVPRADALAHRPEAFAEAAYGGRMGNGPEGSGDGFTYRGRGWLMLTGRENYRKVGQRIGVDLEANPDLAAEPEIAMRVAEAYWFDNGLHLLADADDLAGITRRINGGLNGLDDRRRWLTKFKKEYGA